MKPNNPHEWAITLRGRRHRKVARYVGRLDEALAEADVLESGVAFVVTQFTVKRGRRVREKVAV